MAQNLATKYAKKVDERFALDSFTQGLAFNEDYDWVGSNAIKVYSVDTVAMGNYTRTGSDRYGVAGELGTTLATYALARDRSATWTIDKRNYQESQMAQEAGKSLARQTKEIVVPEIDVYRLAAFHTAAAGQTATLAITKDNAYLKLLEAQEKLDNAKIPLTGRVAYVTPAYYNFLKQDPSFIKATDIAQKMLVKGQVGEVDGVKIIKVPTTYLPANAAFVLFHPSAVLAPKVLDDFKIHQDPPGISGWLCEMRIVYDCFILATKTGAFARHQIA